MLSSYKASLEAKLYKKVGDSLAKLTAQDGAQQQEAGYYSTEAYGTPAQPGSYNTGLTTGQDHGLGAMSTRPADWDEAGISQWLSSLSMNAPTGANAATTGSAPFPSTPTPKPNASIDPGLLFTQSHGFSQPSTLQPPALPPRPHSTSNANQISTSISSGSSKDFKYTPLTEPMNGINQIRLLCILPDATPGLGSTSTPLSIKLYHTPLKPGMKAFSALSYSWGDNKDLVTIKCNDRSLKITRSLYNFLRAVRNRGCSRQEPKYIWNDAICINQKDKIEKNYQIPLMGDIYQFASKVLVWLGDTGRDAELALPILPLLAGAAQKQSAAFATTQVVAMHREDWIRMGFTMPEPEIHLRLRAYYRFLRRDWFKRVWIIQEYALARTIVFMCGSGEFSEEQLIKASTFSGESGMDSAMGARWIDSPMQPLHSVRVEQLSGKKVPLMSLLKRYQRFDATNPVDKVYSLLALASDAGNARGGLNIIPDYNARVADVYNEVAMKFIFRDRNLEIITLAGLYTPIIQLPAPGTQSRNRHRLAGLPSWVPDWSVPDGTYSVQQHFERGNQQRSQLPPGFNSVQISQGGGSQYMFSATLTEFRASGSSTYNPNFAQMMQGRLQVRCQFLDTITVVGTPNSFACPIPDDWATMTTELEDYDEALRGSDIFSNWIEVLGAYKDSQRYFTGETMLDVLWQSMLCGHYVHGIEMERQIFMEWYRATFKLRMIAEQLRSKPHARKLAMQAYNSYKQSSGGYGVSTVFMAQAGTSINNRCVFRTGGKSGSRFGLGTSFSGYAGLAPSGIRVGDWVTIIEGASVPMILRQKGASGIEWEVVGACYVHGCMAGQVYDSTKCREIALV